ncbi:hypothetical protein BGZ63DRAFT_422066 [Mariannaea sp. PMI_226]|nr:hypothetical protein BGZ63DRAFT_422066 [Mariannaea sp. PMI_226]
MPHYPLKNETSSGLDVTTAAKNLIHHLTPLLEDSATSSNVKTTAISTATLQQILSAIHDFVPSLTSSNTIFASFHDGQVHDPLGSGSYAFQQDLVGPVLRALVNDETNVDGNGQFPTPDCLFQDNDDLVIPSRNMDTTERFDALVPRRPIVIHAGVQPNNSPHAGTLIVFCYAFVLAQAMRERIKRLAAGTQNWELATVSVEITFVDTAPVNHQSVQEGDIHFQRSYRDTPSALVQSMSKIIHRVDCKLL